MRNITRIRWNAGDISHIAKHGVAPIEVEEVVFENEVYVRSGRNNLYYLLGTTRSGRYLFIVVASTGRPGEVNIVTARNTTEKERQYYRRKGK